MILVVQHIMTSWGKEARGGKGAVLRNAVPDAAKLPLSSLKPDELTFLSHYLRFNAQPTGPHERIFIENPTFPLVVGGVIINPAAEAVLARFRYTFACGAPDRGWMQKTLRIAANEWGQIIYNGRFSADEAGWWYEKHVINVGWFERLTPHVFTREAPTHRFNASALLF